MRRMAIVACGAMIAACTQNGEPVNDAVPSANVERDNSALAEPAGNMEKSAPAGTPADASISACLRQGEEQLKVSPIKALGTEPFWGAKVDGRCVTYSTPEDQAGTRIWTSYAPTPDGGRWSGAFQNRPFELVTRAKPDCSDGMSDRTYPLEAVLTVSGEVRRGCATPE